MGTMATIMGTVFTVGLRAQTLLIRTVQQVLLATELSHCLSFHSPTQTNSKQFKLTAGENRNVS